MVEKTGNPVGMPLKHKFIKQNVHHFMIGSEQAVFVEGWGGQPSAVYIKVVSTQAFQQNVPPAMAPMKGITSCMCTAKGGCGDAFPVSEADMLFHSKSGFAPPTRCQKCRRKKQEWWKEEVRKRGVDPEREVQRTIPIVVAETDEERSVKEVLAAKREAKEERRAAYFKAVVDKKIAEEKACDEKKIFDEEEEKRALEERVLREQKIVEESKICKKQHVLEKKKKKKKKTVMAVQEKKALTLEKMTVPGLFESEKERVITWKTVRKEGMFDRRRPVGKENMRIFELGMRSAHSACMPSSFYALSEADQDLFIEGREAKEYEDYSRENS